VAWNAVSKTATCGRSGKFLRASRSRERGRVVERDQRFGGLDRRVLLYLRDDESDDRTTSLSFHVPVA
jgi:hypothetical protein